MADPERGRRCSAELRRLGVRTSIDDYGTGYSSLAYLRHLPADELKLDRSLTFDVGTDPRAAAIVEHTVALAHDLGLRLVAEGVEDAATGAALARLGCDIAQGYAIARPMPVATSSAGSHAPPVPAGGSEPEPAPGGGSSGFVAARSGERRQAGPHLGWVDQQQAAAEAGQFEHADRRPGDHDLHPAVRSSVPTESRARAARAGPAEPLDRPGPARAPDPAVPPPRPRSPPTRRPGRTPPAERPPAGRGHLRDPPDLKVRTPSGVPATRYQTPDFVTSPSGETSREDGGFVRRRSRERPRNRRPPPAGRAEVLGLRRRRRPHPAGSTTSAEPAARPLPQRWGSAVGACAAPSGPPERRWPGRRRGRALALVTVSPDRSVRAPPTRDQPRPARGAVHGHPAMPSASRSRRAVGARSRVRGPRPRP